MGYGLLYTRLDRKPCHYKSSVNPQGRHYERMSSPQMAHGSGLPPSMSYAQTSDPDACDFLKYGVAYDRSSPRALARSKCKILDLICYKLTNATMIIMARAHFFNQSVRVLKVYLKKIMKTISFYLQLLSFREIFIFCCVEK